MRNRSTSSDYETGFGIGAGIINGLFSWIGLLSIFFALFGCLAMTLHGMTRLASFGSVWGMSLAVAGVAVIAIHALRSRDFEFLKILCVWSLVTSFGLGFIYASSVFLGPSPSQLGPAAKIVAILTPDRLAQGAGWIFVALVTFLAVCTLVKMRETRSSTQV